MSWPPPWRSGGPTTSDPNDLDAATIRHGPQRGEVIYSRNGPHQRAWTLCWATLEGLTASTRPVGAEHGQ